MNPGLYTASLSSSSRGQTRTSPLIPVYSNAHRIDWLGQTIPLSSRILPVLYELTILGFAASRFDTNRQISPLSVPGMQTPHRQVSTLSRSSRRFTLERFPCGFGPSVQQLFLKVSIISRRRRDLLNTVVYS